jgi:D-alanine-D-alanine ligase
VTMHSDEEPPGVVVLYNHSQGLMKGEPRDLLAEQGVIACAHAVAQALEVAGHRVALVPIHSDVELVLAPYPPTRWAVFNLGEGLEGRLFEEARIAWALEAMGYSFTGSGGDAIARSTHKGRAKGLLVAAGVPTPPWQTFFHPSGVKESNLMALPFPLIVKPVAEDASLGVGPEAVVRTPAALRERVAYVVERYRQAALAEQFIAGREFNISLWGDAPEVLPLAEIDFSAFADPFQQIVSFAAKWEEDSFAYHHTPVVCPASVAPVLRDRIMAIAKRAWRAIGCRGYARVDMRVAADGTPYVVEVNCNPDISPDAGFFRAARAAGYDYTGMVAPILKLALRQRDTYDYASERARWLTDSASDGRRRRVQAGRGGLRPGAMGRLPAAGRSQWLRLSNP